MGDVVDVQVAPAEPVFRRHKLDVYEVERMVEAGILPEAAGIELIDGELIDMHPISPEHSGLVLRLTRRLVLAFGDRAAIGVQNPVRLDERNQPQPDFAVLRPRADDYMNAHATPDDVIVLIEVAKSSVAYDRDLKAPLYGRYGVAEYWIIDLEARVLVVFRKPGPGGYGDIEERGPEAVIAPLAAPDVLIELRTLIG